MSDCLSTKKVFAGLCIFLAISSQALAQEAVADRLNTMEAQVQLLRKELELRQALAQGSDVSSLPKVAAIFGFTPSLKAKLVLSNGTTSTVGEGEVIRGGMKVVLITSKEVLVSLGKGKTAKTAALDFVAGALTPGAGGGPMVPVAPPSFDLLPPPPPVRNVVQAAPVAAQPAAPAPGPAAVQPLRPAVVPAAK